MIDFELDVAAPAATVFALFTEPEGLARWMVRTAEVDLRPGGRFRWRYHNGDVVAGRFVEVEAPRRLAPLTHHPGQRGTRMPTNPAVDAWFDQYDNPMKPVVQRVREIVLAADPRITEAIKWKAPTFSYRRTPRAVLRGR